MKKIDPESFYGKAYLLVIDKVIIGAIIAAAFVVYDQYKSSQEHERTIESQKIQLDFERAKLAKEFWPIIMDKSSNILARGYSLRSAILTKALDPETGVDVSFNLFKDGLSAQDFERIVKPCMPNGLVSLLNNASTIANEYLQICQPGGSLKEPISGEPIDSSLKRIESQQRAFRNIITQSIQELAGSSFNVLNNRKFLSDNLFSLFFIFQAGNEFDAIQQSINPLKGIKVVGLINMVLYNNEQASQELRKELSIKFDNQENIQYARSIIKIISLYRNRSFILTSGIATSIAQIAIDSTYKFTKSTNDNVELLTDHWSLRWEAAEFLVVSTRQSNYNLRNAIGSELIVIDFLKEFKKEVESSNSKQSLSTTSSDYDGGKIIRLLVETLGVFKTTESINILQSLARIDENKLRYFPFLKEDINRALTNGGK